MSNVSASEARTHFAKLLVRANKGEDITITRGGKPFARIGPVPMVQDHDPERARLAIKRLRDYARAHPIPNVTTEEIKSWIDEGRL